MSPQSALVIVRALADGVNPVTGEPFPEDSPYAEPRNLRALFAAADALQRQVDAEERKGRLPANFGVPWSTEDDAAAVRMYREGYKLPAMAAALKRTDASVRLRLQKLNEMPTGEGHDQ